MSNFAIPIPEILGEAEELLERFIAALGTLETADAGNGERLDAAYREMHTLKGVLHLAGNERAALVAHDCESCLEPFRLHHALLATGLVDALFAACDFIRAEIAETRRTGSQRPADPESLAALTARLTSETVGALGGAFSASRDRVANLSAADLVPVGTKQQTKAKEGKLADAVLPPPPLALVEMPPKSSAREAELPPPAKVTNVDAHQAPSAIVDAASSETIRVQVGLLDNLMNLVGELVLIRNQVVRRAGVSDDAEFNGFSQRLDIVTTELQDEVMKTRMQPIGTILGKFQRLVRDLSKELGKEIDLVLEGAETEMDRTLIEAVRDPLTHIVRNSVDHGLEAAAERVQNGKLPRGRVVIRGYHDGGQVIVEVVDDGRGLNRDRIGRKAVERGLVSQSALEQMNERELNHLIFLPGFSTAEAVSNISGRGVGMDVVKTNIERIGGVVDISSRTGHGTSIRLKIPLTLAIVPALIVKAGGERYAVPQAKLVELVRVDAEERDSNYRIELLEGRPVLRLRGDLLTLVTLPDLLGLEAQPAQPQVSNIAILASEGGQFGLIVDSIEDSTDIVVKPIPSYVKGLKAFSGATVLGDGAVTLTLDVGGIAQLANLASEKVDDARRAAGKAGVAAEVKQDMIEYLTVDIGAPGNYAMPLCLVNRLEEFRAADVCLSGDRRVVKYRKQIMPLLSLRDELGLRSLSAPRGEAGCVPVVVVEREDRYVGLCVDEILDVVALNVEVDTHSTDREEILGSVEHGNSVLVVLDIERIVSKGLRLPERASPTLEMTRLGKDAQRAQKHILYVEDNGFFQRHVTAALSRVGYQVTTVNDGTEALAVLAGSDGERYSLVLSDIEMPRMGGLELAKRIRADGVHGRIALVALSTCGQEEQRAAGLNAGFDRYLVKLDTEALVSELDDALLKQSGGERQ